MGGCGANCPAASQLCSIITGVFHQLLSGDSTLSALKMVLWGSSKIWRNGQKIFIFERVKIYFPTCFAMVRVQIFWCKQKSQYVNFLGPKSDTPVVFTACSRHASGVYWSGDKSWNCTILFLGDRKVNYSQPLELSGNPLMYYEFLTIELWSTLLKPFIVRGDSLQC